VSNNSNKSPRILLIGLASTFWLIIALVGYYYTHKPFTIDFITGALVSLWRLLIALGIISLSGGIGAWILSSRTSLPALTSIAMQATLGSGILGLVVLLIGVTIGFHSCYFAIFSFASGILAHKHILAWLFD